MNYRLNAPAVSTLSRCSEPSDKEITYSPPSQSAINIYKRYKGTKHKTALQVLLDGVVRNAYQIKVLEKKACVSNRQKVKNIFPLNALKEKGTEFHTFQRWEERIQRYIQKRTSIYEEIIAELDHYDHWTTTTQLHEAHAHQSSSSPVDGGTRAQRKQQRNL